jgi:hypothetical protein
MGVRSMRDVVQSVRMQSIRIECGPFGCIRRQVAGKKLRNLRVQYKHCKVRKAYVGT